MATETIKKRAANVLVENGTDSEGNVRLANVAMGALAPNRWDADKILAIGTALEPCLDNVVAGINGTTTFSITAS